MTTTEDGPATPKRRCGKKRRDERHAVAARWAVRQGGVLSRGQLRSGGLSRHDVRDEASAQRWRLRGRFTVQVGPLTQVGRWWTAIFEVGRGAVLDGATALVAAGLEGFTPQQIDVSVPPGNRPHRPDGVRVHVPRDMGATVTDPRSGLTLVHPARAAINAALWSVSDKQAAMLLAMAVQQRLAPPEALLEQWQQRRRGPRKGLLDRVVADVTSGAQSLDELDFAAECRRRGLPEPTRQKVVKTARRTAYLDAEFEQYAVAVEIDGAQHQLAGAVIDDALRQNAVTMRGRVVLRIPVLGYRLHKDAFMRQVEDALVQRGWTRASSPV